MKPIVRHQRRKDIRLLITLTVAPDRVGLKLDEFADFPNIDRSKVEDIFKTDGLDLRDGIYVFDVSDAGIAGFGGIYSQQEGQTLLRGKLGKTFSAYYTDLITAYQGMPWDEDLQKIVNAVVVMTLAVDADRDPLQDNPQYPSVDQIAAMNLRGGCSTCNFEVDPLLMALGQQAPKYLTVKNIKVRVDRGRDDKLSTLMAYLPHENAFASAFHADLVARLRPFLTRGDVMVHVMDELVSIEAHRRLLERSGKAMARVYGFEPSTIAGFVDRHEAQIREDLARSGEDDNLTDGEDDDGLSDEELGTSG